MRGLLISTACVCVAIAIVKRESWEQRRLTNLIVRQGGHVFFTGYYGKAARGYWWKRCLDMEWVDATKSVTWDNSDPNFEALANLSNVSRLSIRAHRQVDFSGIGGMQELRCINYHGQGEFDCRELVGLDHLYILLVNAGSISNVDSLAKLNLEHVYVSLKTNDNGQIEQQLTDALGSKCELEYWTPP